MASTSLSGLDEVKKIVQYATELVDTLENDQLRQELKIRSILAYNKLKSALDELKVTQSQSHQASAE